MKSICDKCKKKDYCPMRDYEDLKFCDYYKKEI
jgi:RecB family exonuclease